MRHDVKLFTTHRECMRISNVRNVARGSWNLDSWICSTNFSYKTKSTQNSLILLPHVPENPSKNGANWNTFPKCSPAINHLAKLIKLTIFHDSEIRSNGDRHPYWPSFPLRAQWGRYNLPRISLSQAGYEESTTAAADEHYLLVPTGMVENCTSRARKGFCFLCCI